MHSLLKSISLDASKAVAATAQKCVRQKYGHGFGIVRLQTPSLPIDNLLFVLRYAVCKNLIIELDASLSVDIDESALE